MKKRFPMYETRVFNFIIQEEYGSSVIIVVGKRMYREEAPGFRRHHVDLTYAYNLRISIAMLINKKYNYKETMYKVEKDPKKTSELTPRRSNVHPIYAVIYYSRYYRKRITRSQMGREGPEEDTRVKTTPRRLNVYTICAVIYYSRSYRKRITRRRMGRERPEEDTRVKTTPRRFNVHTIYVVIYYSRYQ